MSLATHLSRGVIAGIAGTAVMTGWQTATGDSCDWSRSIVTPNSTFATAGGVAGTIVSATFLWLLAGMNLVVLSGIARVSAKLFSSGESSGSESQGPKDPWEQALGTDQARPPHHPERRA